MSTWDEFDALLTRLTTNDYSRDEAETKRKTKDAIRRAYFEMQRRERENDTLRQMLVDLGVENARLSIAIETETIRANAAEARKPLPAPKADATKATTKPKGATP